jgi:hypothetical protein
MTWFAMYFYVFFYPRGGPQTRTDSPIRTRNPRGLPILQPSPHRCGLRCGLTTLAILHAFLGACRANGYAEMKELPHQMGHWPFEP